MCKHQRTSAKNMVSDSPQVHQPRHYMRSLITDKDLNIKLISKRTPLNTGHKKTRQIGPFVNKSIIASKLPDICRFVVIHVFF